MEEEYAKHIGVGLLFKIDEEPVLLEGKHVYIKSLGLSNLSLFYKLLRKLLPLENSDKEELTPTELLQLLDEEATETLKEVIQETLKKSLPKDVDKDIRDEFGMAYMGALIPYIVKANTPKQSREAEKKQEFLGKLRDKNASNKTDDKDS